MKIYTRTGDKGNTQVYADTVEPLPKNHRLLEVYGTLDELNAHLGLLASYLDISESHCQAIFEVQQKLFHIGFTLSASSELTDSDVTELEHQIDQWHTELPPQTSFILPGGCTKAAQAQVCRTVCRRAERHVVALSEQRDVSPQALCYLNRLSDWLFTLSRYLNHQQGITEQKV
ncbi:Cob(I)yrinic acid a,c-diamide adenosyltransferase [Saliniradius amylolyticus]|uniref:Corrinoid adenosyltransferase n=1 Tax=Saliniradius amylolyticus TaxID=2183582 RepID=A0A2S2E215_9ALTE|nr:cob(I)yrinic acid a,c-diamide adenosyltransferase [Saliniradius amylolyticus]AWL11683.1 Cob(I)yrinic acid a,c-diamide adenosyltransferase [Saliniradius amylolyticus]